MPLKLSSTAAGTTTDYSRYVYQPNPIKTDRMNEATVLDFTLVNLDASFVKLVRGNYITYDTVTYPKWFTGYIVNDPEPIYVGTKAGVQQFCYHYKAVSDEYILNLETIGIIPPFINTDMGTVIKTLVNQLCPGIFDVTGVGAGLPIARLVVDPTFKFIDVVSHFTTGANHRFFGHDHKLFFIPQDSVASGLTVDGSSKHFTPSNLTMQVSSDPVINDAVVLGNIEPQQYMNEYFASDGLTGSYQLASAIFGVDRSIFLDDDFSASTIDSTKWTYFDTSNTFLQISNGYLNCLGGNNNNAFDVMLQSVSLIPLEGNLSMTHGEWDFLNSASRGVNGVIGGMWTQTPNSALTGCFSGLRVFNQTNLIPDSDEVSGSTYWTQEASLIVTNGAGAVRGNGWVYTGTGAASTFHFNRSATITVTPLATYTISGYVDASHVTSGGPGWIVEDVAFATNYANAAQTAGVNGRVSVTFTVPSGVTQVKVAFDTNNCIVANGTLLIASNPQLELGSTATPYETNNTGSMDTKLMPVINGVLDRTQWVTVDFTKRYIIKTVTNVVKIHRRILRFSYINAAGVVVNNGGTTYTDVATIATVISEVDPATGGLTNQTFFYDTTALTSNQTWGIYVPLVSNDLHATVTGITVSSPLNAMLELAAPNTLNWKQSFIGPNQMDALDGVTPIATIIDANSGTQTSSSLLGNSQYNPGQATLQFFKNSANQTTTVPSVGTLMHLRYRRPGAAIARITDMTSQGIEASAWGDSGLRSSIRKDLQPVPRNSEECAWAAQAIVGDNNYQHYEGSYKQYSDFCTSEPQSGQILRFSNLPTGLPSVLQAEELNEVKTTFLSTRPERFLHEVTFGKVDRVKRLLARFYAQSDAFQIVDTTETPAAIPWNSVGTAFAPDVIAPTLTSWDASNYNFNTNQFTANPNFLLQTAALSGSPWFGNQLTSITDNSATVLDPLNGHTATKLVCNGGTDPTLSQVITGFGVLAGQSFTGSVWVLGSGATVGKTFTLYMYNAAVTEIYTKSVVMTADWQRIKLPITWSTTNTSFTYRFDPVDATPFASGDTVYVWGAQCQTGLVVTDYIANGASRGSVGGFEVRYTDDSWGADAGKNLVTRSNTQTFSVPRNYRGKVCFVKAFDTRNKVLVSEDFTAASWTKDGSTASIAVGTNPGGDKSLISTLTPVSGNKRAYSFTGIVPSLLPVVAGAWVKGTNGDTAFLIIGNNVTQNFSTTMVLNGKWQHFTVSGTFDPAGSVSADTVTSNLFCQISLGASPVQITRVNVELNTLTETVYRKTNGSAYGAVSQFASGIKVGFPLIPATPSATIDVSNPLRPIVNVGLPAVMADVWGVEIRASNNSTVLYHKDLTDSGYLAAVIADNSIIKARSLSYFVYTYNLLGEYSTAYNATLTIPTPTASAAAVDDAQKLLYWTETNPALGYLVDVDATDGTFTHIITTPQTSSQTLLLSDPLFFNQRWFRITPFDALGNGTAATLSHVYTPTGVVEFNGNEVAVIPAPATPTTDPVVPTPLSDYPRHVIEDGWGNYKNNRLRYY